MGSPVTLYYLQNRNHVKAVNGLPRDRSRGSQRPTQREERVFNKAGGIVLPTQFIRDGNPDLFRTMHRPVCSRHCIPWHWNSDGRRYVVVAQANTPKEEPLGSQVRSRA